MMFRIAVIEGRNPSGEDNSFAPLGVGMELSRSPHRLQRSTHIAINISGKKYIMSHMYVHHILNVLRKLCKNNFSTRGSIPPMIVSLSLLYRDTSSPFEVKHCLLVLPYENKQ